MRLERVLGDEDSSDKREREKKSEKESAGSFEVSIIIYILYIPPKS